MPIKFPDVSEASPEGLLAIGGNLSADSLLCAYQQGVFPWPISKNSPLTWFAPDPRGIIYVKNFHIPKSFKKFIKQNNYKIRLNHNFESVIDHCAKTIRKHEVGTWITKDIKSAYQELFEQGFAYSIEVYAKEEIVGGLYGVCINGSVSGESMFHLRPNTSKLCLYILICLLHKNQIAYLDTQMVTPIIASFGGEEIPRADFMKLLKQQLNQKVSRDEIFNLAWLEPNLLF